MSVRLDHGDGVLPIDRDINVAPFIDVMLVLLIIFMVAVPLAAVDYLPASTAQSRARPDLPLFLAANSDLTLALCDRREKAPTT